MGHFVNELIAYKFIIILNNTVTFMKKSLFFNTKAHEGVTKANKGEKIICAPL
jgi:hypothetical protein